MGYTIILYYSKILRSLYDRQQDLLRICMIGIVLWEVIDHHLTNRFTECGVLPAISCSMSSSVSAMARGRALRASERV